MEKVLDTIKKMVLNYGLAVSLQKKNVAGVSKWKWKHLAKEDAGNREEMEKIGRGTYSDEGGITVVAAK
ncbi:hypothetical protein Csa_011023 [Cucumis sativus]|uniref:Uncharacterized protein n=1 Tax=Cucumis sativus TaxID=3659 RepID=A0A0A0L9C2_CUCSA|nr:hypothetical protein Csa_011023 [Cucumis sativus]